MTAQESIICDCGHTESEHSEFTRGYGIDKDGKTMCYTCCAESDKRAMRKTGKYPLYFTGKEVTNWPGSLRLAVVSTRESRHNWGLKRIDFWFNFEGQPWHGYTIGENTQIAHCKRNKTK